MDRINLIIASVAFFVIFLFFYIFNLNKASIILKKKKKKKERKKEAKIVEVSYLVAKFNLKKERLLTRKILMIISLLDAFIISNVFIVITVLPMKLIWQMLIGFVLLFGLIYSVFGIFGSILLKRGYDKNEL